MVGTGQHLAEYLITQKWQLAVAESCTGGLLAETLTRIPGSSRWFLGGVVAYSNLLKEKLLCVSKDIISTHGAVSEPTAKAMACGVRNISAADVSVATTGIAGPDGGTPDKPVGTVCFAFSSTHTTHATTQFFSGTRLEIREQAVHWIIQKFNYYFH